MTFNVSLSNALTVPVSLTATTTNGTAAAPSDFAELVVVPIDFAPGQTSKTVSVTVVGDGDGAVELDEAFQVVLSGTLPSGSAFARSAATGTIINDDIVVVKPRAPHETGERSPPPKHTWPPNPPPPSPNRCVAAERDDDTNDNAPTERASDPWRIAVVADEPVGSDRRRRPRPGCGSDRRLPPVRLLFTFPANMQR